jgi:hypothetical protein
VLGVLYSSAILALSCQIYGLFHRRFDTFHQGETGVFDLLGLLSTIDTFAQLKIYYVFGERIGTLTSV